jgi:hypothetical protein
LVQRVESLEDLMAGLIRAGDRTERQVAQTSRELSAFKQEMVVFREEMAVFRDEVRADIRESKASRVDMNRKWGELANRLGTMAEDLVAPSVPRVLRDVLGLSGAPVSSAVRVRRPSTADPSVEREFDVVATCGDYLLINETKSRLAAEDVARFVEVLATARDYFPEHAGKRVVGVIASLYVDPAVVRRGEATGLIVLGFGEEVMAVLNSPGFVPRTF